MKLNEMRSMEGSRLGLYDSDTGRSIPSLKVIDVTKFCPESKQVVVKYGIAKRGLIAQICDWYRRGKDLGTTLHYFVNEMTPETLAADEIFERHAVAMGADARKLAEVIFENAV